MIKTIRIHALKSVKDLEVGCSNLTVLVGTNSSGKSTILQSLLLLVQNNDHGSKCGLVGPLVNLGSYRECYSNYCSKENGRILVQVLDDKEDSVELEIKESDEDDSICVYLNASSSDSNLLEALVPFKKVHYLSCNRVGVQEIYDNKKSGEDSFGVYGQFAFAYLLNHKNDVVDADLICFDKSKTLISQVNHWLRVIMNADISVEEVQNTNKVKVLYSVGNEQIFRNPLNVGSGLSYIATILIMCLASKKDSLLLIENPEIHLHPRAQSKLVEFFYAIAKSGRQIVLETHSDHVFNGIRAGIATNSFNPDFVKVNFVSKRNQEESSLSEISIGNGGRIMNPQKDLFDQFDLDLDRMLGLM